MKGKKKSNTVNIAFLGEVSDYSLTIYLTRRSPTVCNFPRTFVHPWLILLHRELCSVRFELNTYPFITPPFCDMIYSILLLAQEYRVVAILCF